jgi:hypothetical protein
VSDTCASVRLIAVWKQADGCASDHAAKRLHLRFVALPGISLKEGLTGKSYRLPSAGEDHPYQRDKSSIATRLAAGLIPTASAPGCLVSLESRYLMFVGPPFFVLQGKTRRDSFARLITYRLPTTAQPFARYFLPRHCPPVPPASGGHCVSNPKRSRLKTPHARC